MPRKKVGAVHSGKVDGVDIKVHHASLTFAEKRNREATRSDVADDLWRRHEAAELAATAQEEPPQGRKKIRREDLAAELAATSSGSSVRDIRALPKYLENLESGQFYDPHTRSMRGNPHAPGVISLTGFQGDNAKYETEDALGFVRQQLHFLTGESKTIVDFAFDEELQRKHKADAAAAAQSNAECSRPALESSSLEQAEAILMGVVLPSGKPSLRPHAAADTERSVQPPAASAEPPVVQMSRAAGEHSAIYGSYFDKDLWRWGYKCCRSTTRASKCSAAAPTLASVEQ
jgi:pre-mRNA-processing factor SLU7